MEFARFMSSTVGRLLRIAAGIALIVIGLGAVHGVVGILLAVVGVVPFAAGLFKFCVFAPLFGGPFWAKDLEPKPVPIKTTQSKIEQNRQIR